MSIDAAALRAGRASLGPHAASMERHASWARDFAVAGDLESAIDALRDLHALSREFDADAGGG